MTDTPSPSLVSDHAANHAASGVRRELIEIARTTGFGLAIARALRIAVFQPFTSPSSSMEPGLDFSVIRSA